MKQPFDQMANNRGLHYDDYRSGKGYSVCYDKVKKELSHDEIINRVKDNVINDKGIKGLDDMNLTYAKMGAHLHPQSLQFHMVDKE